MTFGIPTTQICKRISTNSSSP